MVGFFNRRGEGERERKGGREKMNALSQQSGLSSLYALY